MADRPAQRSFEGLPTEIRLRIYDQLFAGTEIHVKDYGDSGLKSRKVGKVRNTGILRVSRKFREEAYPVFEKQRLTLVLYGNFGPRTAAKLFPHARTIITDLACLETIREEDHFVKRAARESHNLG